MAAWLIKAFIPVGAFPILTIQGEQGSAKSTTAKMIKELIDPARAPLRSPPKSERDLFISAVKSWVLAYDNLSGMLPWISDSLCRLSIRGGFTTRQLHTDADEIIFDASRPIIINGIEDLATRNDLADRSLVMYLPAIPKGKRKTEALFWKDFEEAKPMLLGAIMDAVSVALRNFNNVGLSEPPRMADFAHWIVAAESTLPWEKGRFMAAYERNRREALSICFEVDMLADLVSAFVRSKKSWEGTASELLDALKEFDPDETTGNRSFPKAPNALSNRLRRLAPSLRSEGVDVDVAKSHGRKLLKLKLLK
jgi:hypothetical protein